MYLLPDYGPWTSCSRKRGEDCTMLCLPVHRRPIVRDETANTYNFLFLVNSQIFIDAPFTVSEEFISVFPTYYAMFLFNTAIGGVSGR